MDMEIKLTRETIQVAKHELELAKSWEYKLQTEKREVERLNDKHKKSNEGVLVNLRKYEDLANKLRKESDKLRADLMFKEPGFSTKEQLPQSYCDYHGTHGHSGSKCAHESSVKKISNSNLKPIGTKFKKIKMET